VKDLEKARAKLVETRRALVHGLATPVQWSSFIEIQMTIEKIDQAIDDEKKNAPTAPVRVSANDDGYEEIKG
jgi:hypothetical protein